MSRIARRGRVQCLAWLALIGVLIGSQAAASALPVSVSQVIEDPAVVHGTLDNGFQYVLMKNATPKDRVSVYLNIFAGSAQESNHEKGVAHFLEHMLLTAPSIFPRENWSPIFNPSAWISVRM